MMSIYELLGVVRTNQFSPGCHWFVHLQVQIQDLAEKFGYKAPEKELEYSA